MRMRNRVLAGGVLALLAVAPLAAVAGSPGTGDTAAEQIARGRYLVLVGGCNTCHTPGFTAARGKIPEKLWLVGDTVGWRGSWGTTYAANLRAFMNEEVTEEAWVKIAGATEYRQPMPWTEIRAMTEADRRAVYRFVTSLGAAGGEEPEFVPPGKEPKTSFVNLAPQAPRAAKPR